ncbi:MAG: hypothetical protein NTW05_28480 [Pseudonocardiales bacterium]|nr:hypothetical protein [Pseudonocardiales bacterium]
MRFDDIPAAATPPADARPSAVVERLRALRPSRRTVLRGLLLGAAAAALVPLDWYLTRREAVAAPADGGDRSEFTSCRPENYDEERNNWPSGGPAVCYGGWRRGGFPCEGGYHREGRYDDGGDTAESTRSATSCYGRNAWRWNGYRCSDALTTVTYRDGTEYNGVTIAACVVEAGDTGGGDGDDGGGNDSRGGDSGGDDSGRDDSGRGDGGGSGGDEERAGGGGSRGRGEEERSGLGSLIG